MDKDKHLFAYTGNYSFQYYPAKVYEMQPTGTITLCDFLLEHLSDYGSEIFQQIAKAESVGDNKLKAELKQNNLKVFTPCVKVDGYKDYKHINSFTGLAVLDFDHLDSPSYSEEFKYFLFEEYDFIISAWLSPSKHGIKALASIPIVSTVDEFKGYYWGIEEEMKQYKGWDGSGQNPTLSLFQSYDPDLLLAADFTTWSKVATKKTAYDYTTTTTAPNIDVTDKDKFRVTKIIESGMNSINDNGHPQLRSLCISFGGYVGTGYLGMNEAEQFIDHLIASNSYLCKDVANYQKTARWGLKEGTNRPLLL